MDSKFYENNRAKLSKYIGKGEMAVLFSGKAPKKLGDESYRFTPLRNFYYLTGIDRQSFIYIIYRAESGIRDIILIEPYDEVEAKWTGAAMLPDEVIRISGIENIGYNNEFKSVLDNIVNENGINKIYMDIEDNAKTPEGMSEMEYNTFREKYNIENIHDVFGELRLVKEDCEAEYIRKAISITKDGIYAMMRNAKAGMYEYEIEAHFDYELKRQGVRDFAFTSIVAAGHNGTVLHYSENNTRTAENDLVLCDVGAQYKYYNGDITRTFPVSGKFTERQKQIYNIVLEGQQLVIDSVKPGIEFKRLNEILKEYYAVKLREIGLITSDEEVSRYYYHGVSHSLGLETHDIGRRKEGLIRKGMIFTVEPGLYIAEENIGIRIEDNVMVTDTGCIVLSADIIKSVEDIEGFMAGNKND